MKRLTITIGIPTYNEADAVLALMGDLLRQETIRVTLAKIIVACDGCTDDTFEKLKKLSYFVRGHHFLDPQLDREPAQVDHKVIIPPRMGSAKMLSTSLNIVKNLRVLDNPTRRGKAYRLNQIKSLTHTDILVILDGDVRIKDMAFIEKIARPIVESQADLVGAQVLELAPKTIIQKILATSMDFKRQLFVSKNHGNNVYTCHGRARAFSQKLYKQIKFKSSFNEDSYSYLFAKQNGFTYSYQKKASVYYALPKTFADHLKQSTRFFSSRRALGQDFDEKMLSQEYGFSITKTISVLIPFMIKNPLIIGYFGLLILTKVLSYFKKQNANTWNIAKTSKHINLKGVV